MELFDLEVDAQIVLKDLDAAISDMQTSSDKIRKCPQNTLAILEQDLEKHHTALLQAKEVSEHVMDAMHFVCNSSKEQQRK